LILDGTPFLGDAHLLIVLLSHNPYVHLIVVVGTVQRSVALIFLAGSSLVYVWMIFLLLPAVVFLTAGLHGTALFILSNESFRLPVLTSHEHIIVVQLGLPPEVLPVMSIVALSLVVFLVERAPFRFEIEHIEV